MVSALVPKTRFRSLHFRELSDPSGVGMSSILHLNDFFSLKLYYWRWIGRAPSHPLVRFSHGLAAAKEGPGQKLGLHVVRVSAVPGSAGQEAGVRSRSVLNPGILM